MEQINLWTNEPNYQRKYCNQLLLYIPLIACCTKCTGPVLYRCLFKLFIGSQCLFNLLIGFGVCALPIGSQCLFTHMQITIPQSTVNAKKLNFSSVVW